MTLLLSDRFFLCFGIYDDKIKTKGQDVPLLDISICEIDTIHQIQPTKSLGKSQ